MNDILLVVEAFRDINKLGKLVSIKKFTDIKKGISVYGYSIALESRLRAWGFIYTLGYIYLYLIT